MANVWKVGSRWSDNGSKESSIISIFRRNNVVFVGQEDRRIAFRDSVKQGDYIAIADGYTIVAVAKAISNPTCITKLDIKVSKDEAKWFNPKDCEPDEVYAVKVKIVDLDETNYLYYEKRTSFCRIYQCADEIVDLYENSNKRFKIKSNTYTLMANKGNQQEQIHQILDGKTHYVVPIYQREYSWNEDQLSHLINDIFTGYWGINKDIKEQEPIFIGTMQLSEKKFISKNEYEQEIIDGQQRLSTFLVLLKTLQILYPQSERLQNIKLNWLETRVNNGEQDKYLQEFIDTNIIEEKEKELNPYKRNACIIKNLIQQNTEGVYDNKELSINNFVDYLCSQVYFIVIETYAGLSKTLQIFNAINTTGLDLNGGDLFKIRMYEYLRDKCNQDEGVFQEIGALYQRIDTLNKEQGREVLNIHNVLSTYKYVLIAKYDLPNALFLLATDTFYDRLFDSLLGVQKWESFTNLGNLKLDLVELNDAIDARYDWEVNHNKNITTENMFALNSIRWSRYSRYTNVVYLFLYKYEKDLNRFGKVYQILHLLNRLFFIYSVYYARTVYEIHNFMFGIYKKIENDTFENVIADIKKKINDSKWMMAKDGILNGYIADNAKKKNLICLLSAYLDEVVAGKDRKEIHKVLFDTWFDIEHIHANADEVISIDDDTLQNSIGNLVMLEGDINRSISNKPFSEKKKQYQKSQYASVQQIAQHDKWDTEEAERRRDEEVKKIMNYLYDI